MGFFDRFKKKEDTPPPADRPYVRQVSHLQMGVWHQYDVLLDAAPYGWQQMLDWAVYMSEADICNIEQVLSGDSHDYDLTAEYKRCGSLGAMPSLKTERGYMSIAGTSRHLNIPMKMIWFNQTNALRLFSTADVGEAVVGYVETAVRRTFDSPGQMRAVGAYMKAAPAPVRPQVQLPEENTPEYDAYLKEAASRIPDTQKQRLISLTESGHKLDAIKECREITGVGLKYARDIIENYQKYLLP
ncbi:MAG: hypothetical protein IKP47_11830 [Ruminococcus sp.]|nr:hypothetical protein [Ruminococcus sp.]